MIVLLKLCLYSILLGFFIGFLWFSLDVMFRTPHSVSYYADTIFSAATGALIAWAIVADRARDKKSD